VGQGGGKYVWAAAGVPANGERHLVGVTQKVWLKQMFGCSTGYNFSSAHQMKLVRVAGGKVQFMQYGYHGKSLLNKFLDLLHEPMLLGYI
jgi:hypothetical protein